MPDSRRAARVDDRPSCVKGSKMRENCRRRTPRQCRRRRTLTLSAQLRARIDTTPLGVNLARSETRFG